MLLSSSRLHSLRLCTWALVGLAVFSGASLSRAEDTLRRTVTEETSVPDATLDSVVSRLADVTGVSIHTIIGTECASAKGDFTLPQGATLDDALEILRDRVVGLRVLETPRGFVLVDAHGLRGVEWVHASRPEGTSFAGLLDDLIMDTVKPLGWLYFPPAEPDKRLPSFQKRHVRIECDREMSACELIAWAAEEAGLQLRIRIDPRPQELSLVTYEDNPLPLSRIRHVRPMHIEGVVSWSTEWALNKPD